MLTILQFILILAVFIPARYIAYYITEVKGLPVWLDYRPFNCKLCLTFWLLIGIYTAIWLSLAYSYTAIGGYILAILNAIAMHIDQRNKTIKI